MRRLAVLFGLALLGVASLAHAEPTVNNPMPVYIQQGKRINTVSIGISTTSLCMIAPTGTTCNPGSPTYGSNTTRVSDGALGFLVQNIGAASIFCGETSPALANNGILIPANGGNYLENIAARSMTLYCVGSAASAVNVTRYLP